MNSLDSTTLISLRTLAEAAARAGGAISREAFGRRVSVTLKSDASEVTEIDVAAEKAVFATIRAARPDDALIGEESVKAGMAPPKSGISWIVDPIDGTRNFIRGVPSFACSVAAMHGGQPVAGTIYEPIGDRIYSAVLGMGATANGVAIPRIDTAPPPGQVRNPSPLVAIPSAWKPETAARVRWLVEHSVVRSLGSATIHLVQVATAGVDATLMNNCKLWDIAAGCVIATEVGATATSPEGKPLFPVNLPENADAEMPVLIGAPRVHALLLSAFEKLR